MSASETHRTIRAVWINESGKLIARLTRLVRDVGLAEELAQDALVAALESWPATGVPDNPAAWLMATAKNRGLNALGRARLLERKHGQLGHEEDARQLSSRPEIEAALDDDVGDDLLRLLFIACHPIVASEGRVALTLRMLGGLTTEEIARAFLVPATTIGQRIVRAKRTLAEAQVPFEMPRGPERAARLASVLEVVYLIFNEGHSATAGDDLVRPALCEDALRLGGLLAGLAPDEPEVHGLCALMALHASRLATRVGAGGEPVPLLEQDRARWDHDRIAAGLASLARAEALAAARGPYTLQAALSACHARAALAADTDWARIADLYGELARAAAVPGGRAQPRGRDRDGPRTRHRPGAPRCARRRAGAARLPPGAGRARRSAGQARPLRRGARRVRARRGVDAQPSRARPVAPARGCLRRALIV